MSRKYVTVPDYIPEEERGLALAVAVLRQAIADYKSRNPDVKRHAEGFMRLWVSWAGTGWEDVEKML